MKKDSQTENDLLLLELENQLKEIEADIAWFRRCMNKRRQGVADLLDGKIAPKQLKEIPIPYLPFDKNIITKRGMLISEIATMYNTNLGNL